MMRTHGKPVQAGQKAASKNVLMQKRASVDLNLMRQIQEAFGGNSTVLEAYDPEELVAEIDEHFHGDIAAWAKFALEREEEELGTSILHEIGRRDMDQNETAWPGNWTKQDVHRSRAEAHQWADEVKAKLRALGVNTAGVNLDAPKRGRFAMGPKEILLRLANVSEALDNFKEHERSAEVLGVMKKLAQERPMNEILDERDAKRKKAEDRSWVPSRGEPEKAIQDRRYQLCTNTVTGEQAWLDMNSDIFLDDEQADQIGLWGPK